MNIIAAGVALAVMHALPTPGCSYRCMLEQPRARLGHPMHFDMEIEYRGSEAQGSIATSDQDIVLPEYRSLRLLHPPRRGIPGYTTALRDRDWLHPAARFYVVRPQLRYISPEDLPYLDEPEAGPQLTLVAVSGQGPLAR
jgi:hypothetical protein